MLLNDEIEIMETDKLQPDGIRPVSGTANVPAGTCHVLLAVHDFARLS
jgi:hypothetical protein